MANFEYIIYCIYNGGKPFYLKTYTSLISAKIDLDDMISLEKKRNRPYYVHNDFYDNEFPCTISGKVFCIKQREVTDWEIYSEEINSKIKNNIIYLKNFI